MRLNKSKWSIQTLRSFMQALFTSCLWSGEEKKLDCLSALAEDECATLESDSCVSEHFLLTERSIKHVTTRETEVCFMGLSRDRVLIKTGLINNRSKALIMDKYEGF